MNKVLLVLLTAILGFTESINSDCLADNQLGVTLCSFEERKNAEEEIKKLLAGLQNKKHIDLLMQSQKCWESFVATACAFENADVNGTGTYEQENYCYLHYAEQRIERLKRYEELP